MPSLGPLGGAKFASRCISTAVAVEYTIKHDDFQASAQELESVIKRISELNKGALYTAKIPSSEKFRKTVSELWQFSVYLKTAKQTLHRLPMLSEEGAKQHAENLIKEEIGEIEQIEKTIKDLMTSMKGNLMKYPAEEYLSFEKRTAEEGVLMGLSSSSSASSSS
jgi:hypothetical protein